MTFQFYCPNGHVLEGEPADAGQSCNCPTCGILFLIPEPQLYPMEETQPETFPDLTGSYENGPQAVQDFEKLPELLHIKCPNGHTLETPTDMLNQDVLCPHCNVQFRLRMKDSIEFQQRHNQEEENRERRLGRAWLNWVIVLIALGIFGITLLLAS